MTSAINIAYFKYLSKYYANKKVGLVYNIAASYCSKTVIDWVNKWNGDTKNSCNCVVEFVDPSLTSVYQLLDVIYNKPFKVLIRKKYNDYLTSELINKNMTVGD